MEEKEIFITEILVKECRGIKDFKIPLSPNKRKHLIITGKNGSGKTSLLGQLNQSISADLDYSTRIKPNVLPILHWGVFDLRFSKDKLLFAYFSEFRILELEKSDGAKKINLPTRIDSKEKLGTAFLQLIVNLKVQKAFALSDKDMEAVEKIDAWFERFEKSLKNIFDSSDLELIFDRENYNFIIKEQNKQYDFHTLSAGYSAILSIITELIIRMEAHKKNAYDMQGVVLIDEIENHLHVDLQKKILPFLTAFFPKIQFIVTTHSPFVISSVEDAVVCDLEHKIVVQDLSNYSYDALLESYFGVDKYSSVLKEKVVEYETLSNKKNPSVEEKYYIKELRAYLDAAPVFLSKELKAKLQQIDLQNLNNK